MEQLKVSLVLVSVRFPNDTLYLDLYKGKRGIKELVLIKCFLKNMFLRSILIAPFQILEITLKRIKFNECVFNLISTPRIGYIRSMTQNIIFYNSKIFHFNSKFFHDDPIYFESLELDKLYDDTNLNDLFTGKYIVIVENLLVRSSSRLFHLLASQNFSVITGLISVDLAQCGIRVIEEDTFRHISNTLEVIKLEQNMLTTITYRMFYPLIEHEPEKNIVVNLLLNPFSCSCDFFEYKLVIDWIYHYNRDHENRDLKCMGSEISTINCPSMQLIDLNKLCNNCTATEEIDHQKYAQKFQLKLILPQKVLVIDTLVRRKYRVWIQNLVNPFDFNIKWGYTPQKCPPYTFIRKYIQCFIFENAIENISFSALKKFSSSNLTQICINFILTGQKSMWPIHCITINQHQISEENSNDFKYLLRCISLVILLCLFVFMYRLIIQN